jgi:hypothetical protein
LRCKISFKEESYITLKISKFLQILGILNNVFKQSLVQRQYQLYGCEMWTLKQMDIRRIKTAEMKFMKCTSG